MFFVGIAVRTRNSCPLVTGVVLTGPEATPTTFLYQATKDASTADQVFQVDQTLRSTLAAYGSAMIRTVLREADDGARGGLTTARKNRARCEGAALAVARSLCTAVEVRNGRQVAAACSLKLDELDAKAAELVGSTFTHAGAAALACVALGST